MLHEFLPFIVAGLVAGAAYGLAGLGLVLTYKTSGIFNLGYGAVAALASFLFYFLNSEHGMPWPPAAAITLFIFAPVMGIALELMARSLDTATEQTKVAATVGLILIVEAIALFWYPANPPTFPHFLPQSTVLILGVNVTWEQIIIFAFSAASSAALYWFFRSVRLGIVMRGLVDSPELVSMCEYNPVRVRRSAWVIGSVFSSLAGLMLAPDLPLDGISLTTVVFAAFGAAAIGYFTNLPLTFAGGLLIGVIGALIDKYSGTVSWIGGIPAGLPFIILFLVLIVTPRARLVSRRLMAPVRVRRPYHAPVPVRLSAAALAIGLLAIVPLVQAGYLAVWSNALIDIILFLSLGLLVRNSGQISLCQMAFAAVGAAAFGHFTTDGIPWLPALVLATLVAIPVGALIAIPAVRISGVFLALATLGFGLLAEGVCYTFNFMFGTNPVGLAEPRPDFSIGGWNLSTDEGFYYLLLVIVVLVVVAVTALTSGRLGRLLQAMADSQFALETRGATSSVSKVIVFCVSAALASLAGALTGMLYHFATATYFPAFASLTLAVLVIIITVGDPWYAVLGAVGYSVIPGYATGSTVNTTLLLLFGVAAVTAAYATRAGATPVAVQAFLDRLGGRRRHARDMATPGQPAEVPAVHAKEPVLRPTGAAARTGLVVRDLSVSFGGIKAVDGVSLAVSMGTITGLIGPNGAGKSTLFNTCNGLIRPSRGQVLLHGADVTGESPANRARRGLGRTFQRPQLFDSLTVRQNVAMGCEAPMAGGNPLTQVLDPASASRAISAATDAALAATGIASIGDVQVGLLSIGQRRLVELAMVLAGPFDVLLLDEPSSGLDGQETEAFGRVLQAAVAARGIGILLVEHDMTLVREVCDYVYVLDFGSLIFEGTPAQMECSDRVRAAYVGGTLLTDGDSRNQLPSGQTRPAAAASDQKPC